MTHSSQVEAAVQGETCFPLGRRERKVQLLLLKDLEQLFSIDTVKKMIS